VKDLEKWAERAHIFLCNPYTLFGKSGDSFGGGKTDYCEILLRGYINYISLVVCFIIDK
jgi:hypothetical protein